MLKSIIIFFLFSVQIFVFSQTDLDGLSMEKKQLCAGIIHSRSAWNHYWEGTLWRENKNLGTVKNNASMFMANYGLSNNINIITSVAYVSTKATAGQLAGQSGLQDGMIAAKIRLLQKINEKHGALDIYFVGIGTMPLSNYTPDLLPLSIGLKSKTIASRIIADWQWKKLSITMSSGFHYRGNVKLNRNTYYTDRMHYTNLVQMPNTVFSQIRAGYRNSSLQVETIYSLQNTLGGFDITRNNMPFVSNKMNLGNIGIHAKWEIPKIAGLSLLADASTVLHGRNMGQSNSWLAGVFYIFNLNQEKK